MTATFSPALSWAVVLLIVALVALLLAPLWPDSHPGASDDSSASARRGGATDGRQR